MLAGSLTEFALPDVFALLGATRKTGVLNLTGSDASGRVWILAGQLAYAVADVNRSQLAARLLHGGEILPEDVAALVHSQAAGNGVQMFAALAGVGVPADRAASLLHDQVVDAAFDLSRWAGGDFAFDASSYGEIPDSTPTFSADEVMTAVELRMVEWEGIVTKLPSPASVLRPVSRPVTRDGIIQIQPDQWEVLTLIDGVRTVSEIIRLTGQGQFTVAKLLSALVDARLVQLREDSGPLTVTQSRAGQLARIEHEVLGAPMPVTAHAVAIPTAAPAYASRDAEDPSPMGEGFVHDTGAADDTVDAHVEDVVAEEPDVEQPVAEEPDVEDVVAEEPDVEQFLVEEDPLDEPVAEEAPVEELVAEEPPVEEPVAAADPHDRAAEDDATAEDRGFDVDSLISGMPAGVTADHSLTDHAGDGDEGSGGFSAADELSLESILSGGRAAQVATDASDTAADGAADAAEEMDEDARIRELAALGLSLSAAPATAAASASPEPARAAPAPPASNRAGSGSAAPDQAARADDDLLSRLIDGVKGA